MVGKRFQKETHEGKGYEVTGNEASKKKRHSWFRSKRGSGEKSGKPGPSKRNRGKKKTDTEGVKKEKTSGTVGGG